MSILDQTDDSVNKFKDVSITILTPTIVGIEDVE